MTPSCPYCHSEALKPSGSGRAGRVIRFGTFWRKSDGREIQRFRCTDCSKGFSHATGHPCYRQNKRQLNDILRKHFCSSVSHRRIAKLFGISRTTVVRKFLFLAAQAEILHQETRAQHLPSVKVDFDDLETFEHTKCKPLSVILVVESHTRRILGFRVAEMPAKGLLAKKSVKKYGKRKDGRRRARRELFQEIQTLIHPSAQIQSDSNPHYRSDVREFFPNATHVGWPGKRGCVTGQGELKNTGYDPLFSINHTFAMLRDNLKRLARKTWCTTKKLDRLTAQIMIYTTYHNLDLILNPAK